MSDNLNLSSDGHFVSPDVLAASRSTRTKAEMRIKRMYKLAAQLKNSGEKEVTIKVADLQALVIAAGVNTWATA